MLRAGGAFIFCLWLSLNPVAAQIQPGAAGSSGGGGGGTVTSVSVVTANGISGSVANPTTTPAITLTLGAITPSSVAIGAGSAITSSGPGGALASGAYAAAAPCSAFGTASGQCAQGGVITAGGPTGSATVAPIITYNAAGQLTAVTSATITPAVGSITGLGTGVATALGNAAGAAGGFELHSNLGTAAFDNTGTSGATIPLNNGGFTQSGTANFTSTFQINGNTITWPAAAITVARIDAAQTFNGNQTFQAAGATGTNSSVSINTSLTNTSNQNVLYTNDTGAGIFNSFIENSSGANTSLVNVPHSAVLRHFGTSAGGLYIGTSSNSANVVFFAGGTATATNPGLSISGANQNVTIGSATPATGQRGDIGQIKETDAAAAPGAGYAVLKWVAGSAGSCNLIAYAGTSTTPVTIASTVGSGC